MQTFMPLPSFAASVRTLDRQRLCKQRVETMQISAGFEFGSRWANHPAAIMWQGYECALLRYQYYTCREWVKLGYKDTCLEKSTRIHDHNCPSVIPIPWWRGHKEFHRSHQSNLIRKNAERYGPMFPGVPDDLPYLWPTQVQGEFRVIER